MMQKWRTGLFSILFVGALGLIFFTTGLVFADPPADTISYWKLDEDPAPAEYVDSVGTNNGVPGPAVPAPTPGVVPVPTITVPNTAQLFDGATTGIDVTADASFDWAANASFSIELWMNRVDNGGAYIATNEVIIGRDDTYPLPAVGTLHWWVGIDKDGPAPNVATFVLGDTGAWAPASAFGVTGTTDIANGQWHHIVAVRDDAAGAILMYVDGVLENQKAVATGAYANGFDSTEDLTMGYMFFDAADFFFEGSIDEVSLYDKALTLDEIKQHYVAGLSGQGIDDLEIKVTLLSPNGGEVIPSGSPYTIEWVAPLEAETFKLKFSSDNGATWELIEEGITGTGYESYESDVPTFTKNKTNCLIKVVGYDASGVKVGADKSDSPFTIAVLTVTSPNGGEVVPSGGTYDITWETNGTESEVESVELFYSRDGGTTWKLIEEALIGNPGTYEWNPVPTPAKNLKNCLVKVKALDASGNKVAVDKSDATFTIAVLEVTSPNGGETLTSGDTHTITWTTNETKAEVAKVKLLYTKNGGETWIKIDTLTEGDPETYEWLVPSVNNVKTECRVKVELKDAEGNSLGKDKSDNVFTIEPAI
jgi:hypothetical protein